MGVGAWGGRVFKALEQTLFFPGEVAMSHDGDVHLGHTWNIIGFFLYG